MTVHSKPYRHYSIDVQVLRKALSVTPQHRIDLTRSYEYWNANISRFKFDYIANRFIRYPQ